mmetsp:Transcript_10967/g.31462  ORF Transcript_10967/g.31462 Transcript_10967/m.31462 type:complete len:508 (-) Transcript_10967:156-1679(-)
MQLQEPSSLAGVVEIPTRGRRGTTEEIFEPSFESPSRSSPVLASAASLLATMTGGGMLTLPYAFAQTGLVGGTILQLLSAIAAGFSLYILIASSRRTGATTYSGVARRAFGPGAETVVTVMTLCLTVMVTVAYMVLVRDVAEVFAEDLLPVFVAMGAQVERAEDDDTARTHVGNVALGLLATAVALPLSLCKSLHGLRFVTPVSMTFMVVLTLAVLIRGTTHAVLNWDEVTYDVFPSSWGSLLSGIPIFTLSYMCHFNAISMHAELTKPTRHRLKLVILVTISVSTVIYVLFGLSGYLYGGKDVPGDVLTAFDDDDPLIGVGRIGLGLSMLCNIPLMALPTRDLIVGLLCPPAHNTLPASDINDLPLSPIPSREATPLLPPSGAQSRLPGRDTQQEQQPLPSSSLPELSLPAHVGLTVGLLSACYLLATSCSGVETVWGICGSSVGILLALTFPSALYSRLRGHKTRQRSVVWAKFTIIASIVLLVLCSIQVFSNYLPASVKKRMFL